MLNIKEIFKNFYSENQDKIKTYSGFMHNIARLTYDTAVLLGSSDAAAFSMGKDALLHDIGKIFIPQSITMKPGKLTKSEFNIMKQHTLIGAAIIGNDEKLTQLKGIALTHHEWWNGAGYPYGLKGNNIPLAGRIVAVADVFDALISDRPYKTAWPVERALNYIEEGAGTHFDPIVVDAFLSLIKA